MSKSNIYYIIAVLLAAVYFTLDIILGKLPTYVELPLLGIIIILFVLMFLDDRKNKKGK